MVFFFKPAGNFVDRYPGYLTIPTAFILRGIAIITFMFANDPNSYFTYLSVLSLIMGTLLENIAIDATFTRNLPKDVRGTMTATYNFFGKLGVLIFSAIAGLLYDKVGPKAPFLAVVFCDFAYALLIIILRLIGKFN